MENGQGAAIQEQSMPANQVAYREEHLPALEKDARLVVQVFRGLEQGRTVKTLALEASLIRCGLHGESRRSAYAAAVVLGWITRSGTSTVLTDKGHAEV